MFLHKTIIDTPLTRKVIIIKLPGVKSWFQSNLNVFQSYPEYELNISCIYFLVINADTD